MSLRMTLVALLLISAGSKLLLAQPGRREAAGIIYFTNNSPDNIQSFPIEVLITDKKKVVAATRPDDHHEFRFSSLKPGKYLLRVSWPNRCVLWYRLDLTKQSRTGISVFVDVDCAHFKGKIQDLPVN